MAKAAGKEEERETVSAAPVKSFFVTMLTRDIKLEEAILDLLDNCVDGILRNAKPKKKTKPYDGFWAEIEFNASHFSIHDNCGGIPYDLLEYAFRMGRPLDRPTEGSGTVGVYGIGMKRAIFKMGRDALISTQNESRPYEVEISPDWMKNESEWLLPFRSGERMKKDGTTIWIGKLHRDISSRFGDDKESFSADLERMIASHYAFIIEKGFQVRINGHQVKARPTKLVFTRSGGKKADAVQPYIWKTTTSDDVEVFLSVGLTRPIPTDEELAKDSEKPRYSSLDAGWTVVCNDRAVLYCDRTELTGWGDANVPHYHSQFIAISGIVEFKCDDPSKLPMTTTKRGIDASSRLYLQVKNKMRDGMKIFTDYTYRWKGREHEAKEQIEDQPLLDLDQIKEQASRLKMTKTKKTAVPGDQYMPSLPSPKAKGKEAKTRRILFYKDLEKIRTVSEHLFKDADEDPSSVGERCFDIILKEAK